MGSRLGESVGGEAAAQLQAAPDVVLPLVGSNSHWVVKLHHLQIRFADCSATWPLIGPNACAPPARPPPCLQDNLGRCEEGRSAPCKVIVS